MSRTFKFIRFDEGRQPLAELSLHCLDDADALLIGARLGWRVEIWDGSRVLGVVGEGAVSPSDLDPANASNPNEAPLDAANSAAALEPAIQPMALPQTPPAYQTASAVPRAYNPFRKGAWQRRPQS